MVKGVIRVQKNSREFLIDLCEKSIVQEDEWDNRDTPESQMNVGKLWALLKCGCDFKAEFEGDGKTINVEVVHEGFMSMEGPSTYSKDTDYFYLPTPERLIEMDGTDWY